MYEPIDIDTYQDNEVGREVGRKVDDALASLTEIMTPLQLESAGNRRTLDNERSDGLFWEKNMKPFAVIDLDDDLNAIISRRKKRCCREERCALFCLALGISIIGILVFIAKNPVPFETSERAISLKAILSDLHPLHPKAFTWLAQTDVWEPPILNNTSTTNRTHQMWRERYALASIFFSTNGHQWNLKADDSNDGYQIVDWLTSESTVCAWHHVRCRCLMPDDHVPCSGDSEVVSLQLSGSNLVGKISKELGELKELGTLFLDNNQLTGSIPNDITRLTRLNALQLYNNKLTGSVPVLPSGLVASDILPVNCKLYGNCFSDVANATSRGCDTGTPGTYCP